MADFITIPHHQRPHAHQLADIGSIANPRIYRYPDGCTIIVHADGSAEFVPNPEAVPDDGAKPVLRL